MQINPVNTPMGEMAAIAKKISETACIFSDGNIYFDSLRLFYAYYGEVPSVKVLEELQIEKAMKWFEETYSDEIVKVHRNECYEFETTQLKTEYAIYILKEGMLVHNDFNVLKIVFPYALRDSAQKLFNRFLLFVKKVKNTSEISLITTGPHGLASLSLKIKKPSLHLQYQYNDDLLPVHRQILKALKKKPQSGLILLHGSPGTGKSTYIRYLIHQQRKPVIFVPPALASNMGSPNFIKFLISKKNCIFIIEDAEEVIMAREGEKKSTISMLLNITDGLLGESLGIQVIATFNTQIGNIDKALLRKGRLIALYEFKALEKTKAKALLDQLNVKNITPQQDMTLAEIYNAKEDEYTLQRKREPIGFQVKVA